MMKKVIIFILLLIGTVGLIGCSDSKNRENTAKDLYTVTAVNGTYVGHENNGIAEFLGIPYAAPAEKWKPSQDLATTDRDIYDASKWGPSSPQPYDEVEIASQWAQDLNCLNLNVWTKDITKEGKPVMIFIHGGGGISGGSYDPSYDGEYFVRNLPDEEDVVMVTINYRLGMFGQLNLEALEGYTDEYKGSMSIGMRDQIQAFKWVHENIDAFGGDPQNVTIFGQSAGGGAVSTHLTIPESRQYFQKAIIESGPFFNRQITPERCKEISKVVFDELGIKTIDELLALDEKDIMDNHFEAIYDKTGEMAFHRVADGEFIPLDSYQEIKNGCARDIKLLIGTTNGEKDSNLMDWDNFPNAVTDPAIMWDKMAKAMENTRGASTSIVPDEYSEVVKEYIALGNDPVLRMADLRNDVYYRQGSILTAEAQAEWNPDTYMYYWTWAPEVEDVIEYNGDNAEVSPFGRALHCMETPFVMNTVEGYVELSGDPEQLPKDLLRKTLLSWYSFAKNGNPNNSLIPQWDSYNKENRMTMEIGNEWKQVSDPGAEDRLLLNKMLPSISK